MKKTVKLSLNSSGKGTRTTTTRYGDGTIEIVVDRVEKDLFGLVWSQGVIRTRTIRRR